MTRHLGALLDWIVVDLLVLGIAVQQYISVSRDLRRTRAQAKKSDDSGHPEGQ